MFQGMGHLILGRLLQPGEAAANVASSVPRTLEVGVSSAMSRWS